MLHAIAKVPQKIVTKIPKDIMDSSTDRSMRFLKIIAVVTNNIPKRHPIKDKITYNNIDIDQPPQYIANFRNNYNAIIITCKCLTL